MANTIALAQPAADDGGPYVGSRFGDVVEVLNANPYQRIWGAAGEPPLPVAEVTLRTVIGGLASFGFPKQFRADSMRTLDSPVDLRWGSEGKGFRRLVHPNGVCLTGRRHQQPSIRQLYPIAELEKPAATATRAPEFMRLLVAPDQPRIPGPGLDFRDEVMAQIFDKGDPFPKRTLTFTIELTDEGERSGPASRERRTFKNWRKVGTLVVDNAVVSHNGDAVIHFGHPTWRTDRNDPATATRVNGRKVR